MTERASCRFCSAPLRVVFADLGMSPPSNALLTETQTQQMERFYPLRAYVCSRCFLVQVEAYETPQELFSDYVYFSSYSTTWLEHSRSYASMVRERLRLGGQSRVVELASNDGYLLKYFQDAGISVLGVEPAANVARVAVEKGIPTEVAFFGVETAQRLAAKGMNADLIVANNVLAHVPEINDFVEGVRLLLKPGGTATFEFPHLLNLMVYNQFDTIYHEHFSYLSLLTVTKIFEAHGLFVSDVEQLPTHGGSLRVWATLDRGSSTAAPSVGALLAAERDAGLTSLDVYAAFDEKAKAVKRRLLAFLIGARERGERVAAYGAAAKGTTLFNFCGIRTDLVDYVVDRNPHKQGKYLPGCHVPIYDPEHVAETRPDFLLVIPWNIKEEIMEQMAHVREWGGRFVVPIPKLEIL
jgi:SAM-dependent methyltransferase